MGVGAIRWRGVVSRPGDRQGRSQHRLAGAGCFHSVIMGNSTRFLAVNKVNLRQVRIRLWHAGCNPEPGDLAVKAVVTRHSLVVFFIIAYALSWSGWLPLASAGAKVTPGGRVTHFPGANRTQGSILAVAIWHWTYNMSTTTVPGRGLIGAITTTCVMAWAVVLLVQELRRGAAPSLIRVEAAMNA